MPLMPNNKELISADLTTAEFQKGLQKFITSCRQMQGGNKPKKYILEKVGGEFTFTPEGYSCILELPVGEYKADISIINSSAIEYGFIALKSSDPNVEITIKHKNSLLSGHILTSTKKDIKLRSDIYTEFELIETAWLEQSINLPEYNNVDTGKVLAVSESGELKFIDKYELCEFYYFRHPKLRDGFMPAYGGIIERASKVYPKVFEYLQTDHGKFLCKTEEEWQALTKDTWATLADGTKVGWDGIGGAPYYVVDTKMDTLRLPDLRGMYAEAAGFDELVVGGVHGDAIRNILALLEGYHDNNHLTFPILKGAFYGEGALHRGAAKSGLTQEPHYKDMRFSSSRVVPTANKNQPRAWGALPCVYLGKPEYK